MVRIYLARHGQDEDNRRGVLNGRRDEPLTKLGEEQARELAEKIKKAGISFDKVYSSPLQRAYKTAEKVCETLGLGKPVKMEGLVERDFGVMTGKPQVLIEKYCAPNILKTETVTYFLSPEGAETFDDLVKRAKKIIKNISLEHKGKTILLVSHGDIGKMIYTAYYNLSWKKVLRMFHFGNSDLLLLSKDSNPERAHVFRIRQHNL